MQTGNAFGHQDEPHARVMGLAAAFIDVTLVSSSSQGDCGHQSGYAGAKDCDFHE
jgi:hypothetical protein